MKGWDKVKAEFWPWTKRILIGAVVIGIVGLYIGATFFFVDVKNLRNSIKDAVPIYTCLTAVVGVVCSGLAILINIENFRRDKQSALFSRWYNQLVLDRNWNQVTKFFDFCEGLVPILKELQTIRPGLTGEQYENEIQSKVSTPYTSSFVSTRKALVSDLSIIDLSFSSEVSAVFDKFQDSFFAEIEKTVIDVKALLNVVRDSRLLVLKRLLDYNKVMLSVRGLNKWINDSDL